jgi:carboxyl-terminal processing protease
MNKIFKLLTVSIISILLFQACEEKEDKKVIVEQPKYTEAEKENIRVNEWAWEEMNLYYLWTKQMPPKKESVFAPKSYFSTLLYSSVDKWSYMTENYKQLVNSFKGIEKAMGYSLALYYKDAGNYDIVAYIEFVYPNTPASSAGLKRGDIIIEINGQTLNLDNYRNLLYNTDNQSIRLAKFIANEYQPVQNLISVAAEEILENPVVKDSVYQISGKTIGYLAYMGFITDFNSSLDSVFTRFKNAGIDDLILDFRYNPGGSLGAANYLCSSIAPASAVSKKSRLVNFNWNSDLQAYIQSQGWYSSLYVNMIDTTFVNLNLPKVYILTTGGTASASELTIIGLKPYMNVVTIGTTTHGKYTASITLPDQDSIWALQPIVLKYSNSKGVSDFAAGFAPDHQVNDSFDFDLGDTRDPMISKAVGLITGNTTKSTVLNTGKDPKKYIISAGRNRVIQEGLLVVPDEISKKIQEIR